MDTKRRIFYIVDPMIGHRGVNYFYLEAAEHKKEIEHLVNFFNTYSSLVESKAKTGDFSGWDIIV